MVTPEHWTIKDQVAYQRAATIRSLNLDYKAIMSAVDYMISEYKRAAPFVVLEECTIKKSEVRKAVMIDDVYVTWFVIAHIVSFKIGQRVVLDDELEAFVLPYPILEWNDQYRNFEQQLFFDKEEEELRNQRVKEEKRKLKEDQKKKRAEQVAERMRQVE